MDRLPHDTTTVTADRRRTRRKLAIAGCAALAVVAGLGWALWERRVELFIVPAEWERALAAVARAQDDPLDAAPREEAGRACRRVAELQGLVLPRTSTRFTVNAIRTMRGEDGYVLAWDEGDNENYARDFLSHGATTDRWTMVALDERGLRRGAPFVVGRRPDRFNWAEYPPPDRAWGESSLEPCDVLRTPDRLPFGVAVDERGIVPLGHSFHFEQSLWYVDRLASGLYANRTDFVLKPPDPSEGRVPVSTSTKSDVVEWARDVSDTPLESLPEVARLLSSPRRGDLLRALYAIERHGPEHSRRALPLLAHDDELVRARAAAVAGNDPSTGSAIAPLLSDASLRVRRAARVALLNADDVPLARRAYAGLLGGELFDAALLSETPFDIERLSSPEIATAVLEWILRALDSSNSSSASDLEYLAPYLAALRPADPASSARALEILNRHMGVWSLDLAAIRLLVGIADGPAIAWLRAVLQGDPLATERARLALEALADRETPLPRLVDSLREAASERLYAENALLALLILTRWGEPGAERELLTGLVDPKSEWTSFRRRGVPAKPTRVGSSGRATRTGSWSVTGDDESERLMLAELGPPAIVPLLLKKATVDAWMDLAVCREFPRDGLREVAGALVSLWPRLRTAQHVWYDAARVFARAEHPRLDGLLVDVASDPESPRTLRFAVLAALLHSERGPVDAAGIETLTAIAASLESPLSVADDEWEVWSPIGISDIAGGAEMQIAWSTDTFPLEGEPALVASLLLMQWRVPGADERFLARVRAPTNVWLRDAACLVALPERLRATVQAILASDHVRYGDVDWSVWEDRGSW